MTRKKINRDLKKFKKSLRKKVSPQIVTRAFEILTDDQIRERISWAKDNIQELHSTPQGAVLRLQPLGKDAVPFVLKCSFSRDPKTVKHFSRYDEIMAVVSHESNVIQPYKLGNVGGYVTLAGYPCILMESGEYSLHKRARDDKRPFDIRELCDVALATCSGLEEVYTKTGFLHRDIKPSNIIMVRRNGSLVAVVSDFEHAEIEGATTTGIKSRPYRAPEVPDIDDTEKRAKYYTPQTDVFALGATLFEMIALEELFIAGDYREDLDWANARIDDKVDNIGLNAIIKACIYHSRNESGMIVADGRYPTIAADVRRELEILQYLATNYEPVLVRGFYDSPSADDLGVVYEARVAVADRAAGSRVVAALDSGVETAARAFAETYSKGAIETRPPAIVDRNLVDSLAAAYTKILVGENAPLAHIGGKEVDWDLGNGRFLDPETK